MAKANEDREYHNCGTTLSVCIIKDNLLTAISIGDSRIYIKRKSELIRITKDHSELQEQVDDGWITEEEMFTHPNKNMINSAVGMSLDKMKIGLYDNIQLLKGDIVMVCSDGVHDFIRDKDLGKYINESLEFKNPAQYIVEKALENNSSDNITVCIYTYE